MNYRNTINIGTLILKKNFISNAKLDSELILSYVLNKTREKILLNLEIELDKLQLNNYFSLIDRRIKKEPISQITSKRYFWNSEFYVNRNVLTPRFETELIVEQALKRFNIYDKINILDIGIGSGCILLSLLKDRSHWTGVGIDISSLAIKNAKINAKIQHIENRIKFIHSDIDKFSIGKYDLIVSNPPYINKVEYNNLVDDVRIYEPKVALCGGTDGFDTIKKVIKNSRKLLKNNGILMIEIGHKQFYETREILYKNKFYICKVIKDLQGIKRCILSYKTNS